MNVLAVGLGGAVGAVMRYLISLVPVKVQFPMLTLLTNLLGALLIGIIVGLSVQKRVGGAWLLFWKAGVCGGFTTFSTFSLETLTLLEAGKYFQGAAYAILSIVLCVSGVALGRYLVLRGAQL